MVMASTMMSTQMIKLALPKNIKYHCILYTCVREYAKKSKYNYDLDNLIDWKNKTNQVFGSPLKLTKTGKLRKNKNNENENLKTTLEILGAQSTHLSRYEYGIDNGLIDGHTSSISSRDMNEPEKSVSQFPKDGISDAQPTNCLDAVLADLSHDLPDHSSREPFEKEETFVRSDERITPDEKKMDARENRSQNDVYIPIVSPIPSGKYDTDTPKSYNESLKVSKIKSNTKRLPTGPPESFSFINKVPLCFTGTDSGEENNCNEILQFKEDIKSLSLRTVPSVKSILNKTMPDLNRFFLSRWREKMITELGEEGFKLHQEATINRGINFHANVMELLSGKSESEIQIMPDNEGHWTSLQTAMKYISGVHSLEEDMQHPSLLYRGVADCIAKYKDVLCVIDWKTSKKPRPLLKNTYDDPLQVAAYIGLVNANRENLKIGEVNHGLLVIIYPDGNPAHIHLMNKSVCAQYWQDWLGRLYYYYQLTYTEKFGTSR